MAPTRSLPPGLDNADMRRLYQAVVEQSYMHAGMGSAYSTFQTKLSQIDRFNANAVMPNHEVAGLTFITRPKLCLATPNLRTDRILATLATMEPISFPFAIRCLLDTKFARRPDIADLAAICPFLNDRSPFLTPLTNCLQNFSGVPDFALDTETTDAGFFGQDLTFATGSDFGQKSYDVTLTFTELQGGFIFALLYIWALYIGLVKLGRSVAYPEDIAARRMCYTSSIYRFVLDPSRRYITKWKKLTGCFPKALPDGSFFNIGDRESFLSSTAQFSVPFVVNHASMTNDPIVLQEFNTLVSRFCPDLRTGEYVVARNVPEHNFAGMPYIDTEAGLNELKFLCRPEELQDPTTSVFADIRARVAAALAASRPTTLPSTITRPA